MQVGSFLVTHIVPILFKGNMGKSKTMEYIDKFSEFSTLPLLKLLARFLHIYV